MAGSCERVLVLGREPVASGLCTSEEGRPVAIRKAPNLIATPFSSELDAAKLEAKAHEAWQCQTLVLLFPRPSSTSTDQ